MHLTPEQKEIGRRNFRRIAGRGVDPRRLDLATAVPLEMTGGPVRAGLIGIGRQGSILLAQCRKEFIRIEAVCDVNPAHRSRASAALVAAGGIAPREYADWQEMAAREKLEVAIVATPLWTHSEITVGFLQAGVNVLCEKMMAWDVEGAVRMRETARRTGRLLEIAYPRFYEPLYQAAYQNIVTPGLLGDLRFVRLNTHWNRSWRWDEKPPSADYDPRRWGYPTWEHLANWRMYRRYSRGLMAELGSHQTSLAEWYMGASPVSAYGAGGIYCYKDGREVEDHVHVTYEFPGDRTAELSLALSNGYGDINEEFVGSRGSLFVSVVDGAMLFPREPLSIAEDGVGDESETLPWTPDWSTAYRTEIWNFCAAVRRGAPLLCGAERGIRSTAAIVAGCDAMTSRAAVAIV